MFSKINKIQWAIVLKGVVKLDSYILKSINYALLLTKITILDQISDLNNKNNLNFKVLYLSRKWFRNLYQAVIYPFL